MTKWISRGERNAANVSPKRYIYLELVKYRVLVIDWSSDSGALALVFEGDDKICLYTPRTRRIESLQSNAGSISFLGVSKRFRVFKYGSNKYCMLVCSGRSVVRNLLQAGQPAVCIFVLAAIYLAAKPSWGNIQQALLVAVGVSLA